MALIQCYECNKQVSDKANACPNCGAPVKRPTPIPVKPKKVGLFRRVINISAAIFFGLFAIVYLFARLQDKPSSPPIPAPAAQQTSQVSENPKPKISDQDCMKDIQCWSEKNQIDASYPCKRAIEKQTQYAFKWTDGFLDPLFSRIKWVDQKTGKIAFIGGKLEVQNQFGAYQAYIYECEYDPATKEVFSSMLTPGRL